MGISRRTSRPTLREKPKKISSAKTGGSFYLYMSTKKFEHSLHVYSKRV